MAAVAEPTWAETIGQLINCSRGSQILPSLIPQPCQMNSFIDTACHAPNVFI